MAIPSELEVFTKRLLAVASPLTNIGAGVIPSLSGMVNSGTENARQLHQAAGDFVRTYNDRSSSADDIRTCADKLEGLLMTSVTVGTISEADANGLIDELHTLTEQAN